MPHKSKPRRVVPSQDRVSFELPQDTKDTGGTAELLRQLSLGTTSLQQPLKPHPEVEEEYSAWLEDFPDAVDHFTDIEERLAGKRIAVFLDYDGTLTPIVRDPDRALISEDMKKTVGRIADLYPTAIISGRGIDKVRQFVGLEELYYAGSHGLDIRAPQGDRRPEMKHCASLQPAAGLKPLINMIYDQLRDAVKHIHGAHVEHNTFCLSVHFRNCKEESWEEIKEIVKKTVSQHEKLLKSARGRKVLDIRPRMDWGKGKAVEHFLNAWSYQTEDVVPVYLGDDRTDEDAFQYLKRRDGDGIGILVSSRAKPSEAEYSLKDPSAVQQFLQRLIAFGSNNNNNSIPANHS